MISVCKQNYEYDKANQLVSSTDAAGKVTHYDYDAAGRLTKEGDKSYTYGWLDKVMNVSENGKFAASFDYGIDGQIANRTDATGKSESFTWDGLALIKRDSTNFVNESAVTGGNPILAFGKDSSKVLFEDMLGSSMGSVEGGKFNAINRSAFGELESDDSSVDFFTGKPQVEGLGYAFLFRNYRAEQGKWQTQDPIGYPDGWNNLAYVNNNVISSIDWQGCSGWSLTSTVGTLPLSHEINDVTVTAGTYTSSLGYYLHNVTEIFRAWGSPAVTGTVPSNPANGMTYTSTETYCITISTYTYTYWEDPISSSKVGGNQNVDVTVTTATATIIKTYTYIE